MFPYVQPSSSIPFQNETFSIHLSPLKQEKGEKILGHMESAVARNLQIRNSQYGVQQEPRAVATLHLRTDGADGLRPSLGSANPTTSNSLLCLRESHLLPQLCLKGTSASFAIRWPKLFILIVQSAGFPELVSANLSKSLLVLFGILRQQANWHCLSLCKRKTGMENKGEGWRTATYFSFKSGPFVYVIFPASSSKVEMAYTRCAGRWCGVPPRGMWMKQCCQGLRVSVPFRQDLLHLTVASCIGSGMAKQTQSHLYALCFSTLGISS